MVYLLIDQWFPEKYLKASKPRSGNRFPWRACVLGYPPHLQVPGSCLYGSCSGSTVCRHDINVSTRMGSASVPGTVWSLCVPSSTCRTLACVCPSGRVCWSSGYRSPSCPPGPPASDAGSEHSLPVAWAHTRPRHAVSRWTRSPRAWCSSRGWGWADPHRDSSLTRSVWSPHPSVWTSAGLTEGWAHDPSTTYWVHPTPEKQTLQVNISVSWFDYSSHHFLWRYIGSNKQTNRKETIWGSQVHVSEKMFRFHT